MKFPSARWRKPEEAEFDRLVRPHVRALYAVLCKLSGSSADAEDILQDLLIKLYPKVSELRELDEPRSWLMRVAYRQFVDHNRRRQRDPVVLQGSIELGDDGPRCELEAIGPERQVADRQIAGQVQAALAELDAERRALVVLHLIEGLTLEEVSGVLELPVGTIKSRLHRLKAQLKRRLGLEPYDSGMRVNAEER